MIQLTEEQSMELFWLSTSTKHNRNRYRFSSKSQWKCLNCLRPIWVNYMSDNPYSIYCDTNEECRGLKFRCKMHANQIEINYFRILKEEQFNVTVLEYPSM